MKSIILLLGIALALVSSCIPHNYKSDKTELEDIEETVNIPDTINYGKVDSIVVSYINAGTLREFIITIKDSLLIVDFWKHNVKPKVFRNIPISSMRNFYQSINKLYNASNPDPLMIDVEIPVEGLLVPNTLFTFNIYFEKGMVIATFHPSTHPLITDYDENIKNMLNIIMDCIDKFTSKYGNFLRGMDYEISSSYGVMN